MTTSVPPLLTHDLIAGLTSPRQVNNMSAIDDAGENAPVRNWYAVSPSLTRPCMLRRGEPVAVPSTPPSGAVTLEGMSTTSAGMPDADASARMRWAARSAAS